VTVCRLAERHKNVDLVLRALAQLKESHPFEYTVIGDGELRPVYEQLTAELGMRERVNFTGPLDQTRLHDRLLESDLFILTTSATPIAYEGFGLVYLEANACGCPVIAARIGGAVEAVREGFSGLLIDTVTPDSIADVLGRVLSGAVKFEPAHCIEFAREFSWARVVDHCLGHYERSLPART
jgi:glycosyltransferase involved in cell wall biosynthesis